MAEFSELLELGSDDSSAMGVEDRSPTPAQKPSSTWTKFRYFLRRKRSRCFKALLGILIFLVLSAVFLLPFFFAPARRFSTSNNLNFGRFDSTSPMSAAPFGGLLTTGVVPKRIHSHNDYLRAVPLYEALSFGVVSVEADVWLVNGQLLIGHTDKHLSQDRTLNSLYLDPLLALFDEKNTNTTSRRGMFDTAPNLPLTLYIDIKSDGNDAFPVISAALAPLRAKGYLTTTSNTSSNSPPTYSLLTVIGTGNTPLSAVQSLSSRDIFFDAPLSDIGNEAYTPALSPVASGDFKELVGTSWLVGSKGRKRVSGLVEEAHQKGIMTRFWSTPALPIWARNQVWAMLLDEGTDFLNADDLASATAF